MVLSNLPFYYSKSPFYCHNHAQLLFFNKIKKKKILTNIIKDKKAIQNINKASEPAHNLHL